MLKKPSLRLTFLFLFFFGLFTSIAFRNVIMLTLSKKALKTYCHYFLRSEFHCEHSSFQAGTLIFEQPRLITTTNSVTLFSADKIAIHLKPRFRHLRLDSEISVLKPEFEFKRGIQDLHALLTQLNLPSSSWLNGTLTMKDGKLLLKNQITSQKYFFQFQSERNSTAHLTISLDNSFLFNTINIEGSSGTSDRFSSTLQINHFDCDALTSLASHFFPHLSDWHINSGYLEGKGTLILPPQQEAQLDGCFHLHQFEFASIDLQFSGCFPSVEFSLHTGEHRSTYGKCTLNQPARLTKHINGVPVWDINHICGGLQIEDLSSAEISLQASFLYEHEEMALSLDGMLQRDHHNFSTLGLIMRLSKDNTDDVVVHYVGDRLGSPFSKSVFDFHQLSAKEIHFFQDLVSPYYPLVRTVDFLSGTLNGQASFEYDQNCPSLFKMNTFHAHALKIHSDFGHSNKLTAQCSEVTGHFDINLNHVRPLSTLNSHLNFAEGDLLYQHSEQQWDFHHRDTTLMIEGGIVHDSVIHGDFAGLSGEFALNWPLNDDVMTMNFVGPSRKLSSYLPNLIKTGWERYFQEDHVLLQAHLKQRGEGFHLEGTLNLQNTENCNDCIQFGCDFLPQPSLSSYYPYPQASIEAINCRESLRLAKGWFSGQDLQMEKFLSPFIFQNKQMHLQGCADIQGSFDSGQLDISYQVQDLHLNTPYFSMTSYGKHDAAHHFNFRDQNHKGHLPLNEACYLEKKNSLLFTDINTTLYFDNSKVHIPEVETFSNGIYFAGSIDVDYGLSDKGTYDIEIHSHTMQGSVSQIQQLFQHFDKPLFFLKLPLSGNLAYRQDGCYLRFKFWPDDYQIQAHVQGSLSEGCIKGLAAEVSLTDIGMNFEYDLNENTFNLFDIEGKLLLGKGSHCEDFLIESNHVRFFDYQHNQAEFDIKIGDRQRDIIRVVGNTESLPDDKNKVKFDFDHKLTHFGDMHPTTVALILSDWSRVDTFELESDFTLNTLFHDLKRFSRTGLYFLSRSMLKEIEQLKHAEGTFNVNLHYHHQLSSSSFKVTGRDVVIDDQSFNHCYLEGNKTFNTWKIDQLKLDDFTFIGDLTRTPESWKVDFLQIRDNKSFVIDLEGEYFDGQSGFDARVNRLQANLAHLAEWPLLKEYIAPYDLQGNINAHGQMHVEILPQSPRWHIDTLLTASARAGAIKEVRFCDTENISCHYRSNRGITLRRIRSGLLDSTGDPLAHFSIEKIDLDLANKQFVFDESEFCIPAPHLSQVAETLHDTFPDIFTETIASTVSILKKEGELVGTLNAEISPTLYEVQLQLSKGKYHYYYRDHELDHFVLDYDPYELKLTTQYTYQQHAFWLICRASAPALDFGELIFTDSQPEQHMLLPDDPALIARWEVDPYHGFILQKIEGELSGISARLYRDPDRLGFHDFWYLAGEVKIYPPKAARLLSTYVSEQVNAWQLGKGWSLKGKWKIGKAEEVPNSESEVEQVHFKGLLEGKCFEFNGYHMNSLVSELQLNPDKILFQNLRLSDRAGVMHCEQISCDKKEEGQWCCSIPLMVANDFRPSFLQPLINEAQTQNKPLVFRQMDLQNFKGDPSNPDSFTGKGRFYFENSSKRNLQNTVFAIPAEIINKIGLDMAALTPVRGTIYYEIKNGKIFLTKFKDVYSEGQASKFYIPTNTPSLSYVDFSGNLNLQVRMKQYSLLFKFTELFTFSVHGTLDKPAYSLQQQPQAITKN